MEWHKTMRWWKILDQIHEFQIVKKTTDLHKDYLLDDDDDDDEWFYGCDSRVRFLFVFLLRR